MFTAGIIKPLIYSSLSASILVVLILLLKVLLKNHMGARFHYVIWFLLLVKLIIPINLQSPISAYNLFPVSNQQYIDIVLDVNSYAAETASQKASGDGYGIRTGEAGKPSGDLGEKSYSWLYGINGWSWIALLWALGVMGLLVYTVAINVKFLLKIRKEPNLSDETALELVKEYSYRMGIKRSPAIVETSMVKSPMLFGFVKPKMLLPVDLVKRYTTEQLRYIVVHELAHMKRRDIAVNWITMFLKILHWFNPFLWFAFYRMHQDREIACDAMVLTYIDSNEHKKYGHMIINMLGEFTAPPVRLTGMAGILGDNSLLKRRVTMINLFKKNTYKISLAGIALLIVVGLVFLPNAISGKDKETKAQAASSGQTTQQDKTGVNTAAETKDPADSSSGGIKLTGDGNITVPYTYIDAEGTYNKERDITISWQSIEGNKDDVKTPTKGAENTDGQEKRQEEAAVSEVAEKNEVPSTYPNSMTVELKPKR